MQNIHDKISLSALRALEKSPTMKAIRAIEDSTVVRIIRDIENSAAMQAKRHFEKSSIVQMMHDIENSPTMNLLRKFNESPSFKVMQELQDSPVIKAFERAPMKEAFSTITDRIVSGTGALTFSAAYDCLFDDYVNRVEGDVSELLDGLTESVKLRVTPALRSTLSAEFYLNLILTLFLFYFAQMLTEKSDDRMLKRISDMEQTISVQLEVLRESNHGKTFLVSDRSVKLRSGPGNKYDELNVLLLNQKVLQLEISGEWTRVEYFDFAANELRYGWVRSIYFTIFNDN